MRKSIILCFLAIAWPVLMFASNNTYTLVVEGFDWGPNATKVILPLDEMVEGADAGQFSVRAIRSTTAREFPAEELSGPRMVLNAYVSDADGRRVGKGEFITLVMLVGPDIPLGRMMEYMPLQEIGRNRSQWLGYQLEVKAPRLGREWTEEGRRILPLVDDFDLDGVFEYAPGLSLHYAHYEPRMGEGKRPLVIWLHGGGEGGTDPTVPLMANRAANYASPEIQQAFDGAWVLVPQSPTFWMQNASGGYNRGEGEDVYHEGLMALIRDFVKGHPGIDSDRVYVGGCSNGGYMSVKLMLKNPAYFAGAYISALAYHDEFLSDADIEVLRKQRIWFVHSADDGTTVPELTVLPTYRRLMSAGATDVHLSMYERVVDLSGIYGGKDYHYYGHSSWIYSHTNHCRFDFDGSPVKVDGRPVTLMEWLAAQHL